MGAASSGWLPSLAATVGSTNMRVGAKAAGSSVNGCTAVAPMSRRLRQQPTDEPISSTLGTPAIDPRCIQMVLRRRGDRAGVTGVHAHWFRHSNAHDWSQPGQ